MRQGRVRDYAPAAPLRHDAQRALTLHQVKLVAERATAEHAQQLVAHRWVVGYKALKLVDQHRGQVAWCATANRRGPIPACLPDGHLADELARLDHHLGVHELDGQRAREQDAEPAALLALLQDHLARLVHGEGHRLCKSADAIARELFEDGEQQRLRLHGWQLGAQSRAHSRAFETDGKDKG